MKISSARWWPKTLYAKASATLATTTLLFLLLTLMTIGYLIIVPVAKRSAEDLAALMMVSAQTWAELPPQTRPDFEHELRLNHDLKLNHALTLPKATSPFTDEVTRLLPYLHFLQQSLEQRSNQEIIIHSTISSDESRWFWVGIPVHNRVVHLGFTLARLGPQLPLAAMIVFILSVLLVSITAFILVRHLIRPLARFAKAAEEIGSGTTPKLLPESGPIELLLFARTFNNMALQVRDLLTDRTTMLSGIAHDLRTPLARLGLTLEMLKNQADTQLIMEASQDLEEMEHLINQYLQLGQVLADDNPETIDVRDIIDHCVIDARRMGVTIDWAPDHPCLLTLQPLVLIRILTNLLQNAARYSEGLGIAVEYKQTPERCIIKVLDQGPGIPEAELDAVFRPFYRIDLSRSNSTGGSGLGLAIAQQLAQIHGWQLSLKQRLGGGTEACIEIPTYTSID